MALLNKTEIIQGFYEAQRADLFTYALSLTRCHASAEDAIQSAFTTLLRRRKMPRELRPYAFRMVRNAALDEYRRRERHGRLASLFAPAPEQLEPHAAEEAEELLALLSDRDRQYVVLKLYCGMTFREVAKVCGIPTFTAATRYRRALKKLRLHLEETGNA